MSRLKYVLQGFLRFNFHLKGVKEADRAWESYHPEPMADMGSVNRLSVLPLIDWTSSSERLAGEMGVSYLIRTDKMDILFDVGFNARAEDPSPLMRNMAALGLDLESFDAIVISHKHFDHVGGWKWSSMNTFSLGNRQIELRGKKVFVPVPMRYPGVDVTVCRQPTRIAEGIATIGAIRRKLFMGWVEEQALAINLEGKGLILIVGCGHQTLPRILKRAEDIFPGPIYGVIGGLHYPVPKGRVKWFGINTQRAFSSGESPFRPLKESDVRSDIALLKAQSPGVVALSGHDSSDEAIGWFRTAFGDAYRDVRVGEEIRI